MSSQSTCTAIMVEILKVSPFRSFARWQVYKRVEPNGQWNCQAFNSTFLNMLGTLDPDRKCDWKSHIGSLVHVYNCTKHDSTEF